MPPKRPGPRLIPRRRGAQEALGVPDHHRTRLEAASREEDNSSLPLSEEDDLDMYENEILPTRFSETHNPIPVAPEEEDGLSAYEDEVFPTGFSGAHNPIPEHPDDNSVGSREHSFGTYSGDDLQSNDSINSLIENDSSSDKGDFYPTLHHALNDYSTDELNNELHTAIHHEQNPENYPNTVSDSLRDRLNTFNDGSEMQGNQIIDSLKKGIFRRILPKGISLPEAILQRKLGRYPFNRNN